MRFMVIGGAGFMGSNLVHRLVREGHRVLVYDKLTYAGRIENIKDLLDRNLIGFVRADLCDEERLREAIKSFSPDVIVNLSGETHVDRSINEPAPFIRTNINCVFHLLEVLRGMEEPPLLIHTSTDEVYGDRWGLPPAGEDECFRPSSPYSASKAAGDLLCQAYWRTYRLPVIIVRPCNNYGPYQHPEKLIPKTIIRALHGKPIPLYGGGWQVRDWVFVDDFAEAVELLAVKGRPGEAYNIPGFNERTNREVVEDILMLMGKPLSLIVEVEDRPGHDRRYAMRGDKIRSLGWKPKTPWLEGLRKTINWYLSNEWWWRPLLTDHYFSVETPWRRERA
ncbi:MAG: dTDP-glucose 4,6-dehydratase [Crenarchaeota archaeon]|nr:dTDP-glucose 4,6-dehydratase [Thermoproteota archaeon]